MSGAALSRDVDIGAIVFLIAVSIILSGVVLVFDKSSKLKNFIHHGTKPLLAAHGCFLLAAAGLEIGKYSALWFSSSLVTMSAIFGIFFGYIGVLSIVTGNKPEWKKALFPPVIGIVELSIALLSPRLETLIVLTSITNGSLCIFFMHSIYRKSRRLSIITWEMTTPFLMISLAYLVRPLAVFSENSQLITISSVGIALAFSLATSFWVFGSMSLRGYMLARNLEYAVNHDSLTGLENRFSFDTFQDRLPKAKERNPRKNHAYIFVDLDLFKTVNDTYGHEAGDRVLVEIAGRIQERCVNGDRVFRMGGDEFLIWYGYDDRRDIVRFLESLLDHLRQPIRYGDVELEVGASLGAHLSNIHDTPSDLVRKADIALYSSKKRGRNCFTIFSEGGEDHGHRACEADDTIEEIRISA